MRQKIKAMPSCRLDKKIKGRGKDRQKKSRTWLAVPVRTGLVPDCVAAKGREAERGEVSPTGLWRGTRVAGKETHVLFIIGNVTFVNPGNENGCSGWIRSVVCVLGGRLVLIMGIARLRMSH